MVTGSELPLCSQPWLPALPPTPVCPTHRCSCGCAPSPVPPAALVKGRHELATFQVHRAAWDFCRSSWRRAVSAPPRPLLSPDRKANGGGSDCCAARHLPSTPTLASKTTLRNQNKDECVSLFYVEYWFKRLCLSLIFFSPFTGQKFADFVLDFQDAA